MVKALLRLAPSGEILIRQHNLTAKQKIVAYMIGKLYSNFAKYSVENTVANKELLDALHMKEGTVKYYLHELRNDGIVISKENGVHQIKIEQIGTAFKKYFGETKKHE